jgi:hypothetical protein
VHAVIAALDLGVQSRRKFEIKLRLGLFRWFVFDLALLERLLAPFRGIAITRRLPDLVGREELRDFLNRGLGIEGCEDFAHAIDDENAMAVIE